MEVSHTAEVLERCRISAPSGSVSPATLPLTFFDIIWRSQASIHRLFFYECSLSRTQFLDTVVPRLKHSLSLTLQYLFPLAGTLTWPEGSTKPAIVCTEGDSVLLTVAESLGDFHQLSGNQLIDINLFYPLIPELYDTSDPRSCPALALQVTLFPNKGICIGLHYNHCAADGKIMVHFIKSWASVSRSNDASFMDAEPRVCFDRSLVEDTNEIDLTLLRVLQCSKESFSLTNKHLFPMEDKFLGTFVIRAGEIKQMKQWVLNSFQNEAPLYLSTHVLACAYAWVCLVKARGVEAMANPTGDPMNEYFALPIDCRSRRKPPLPALYFGNCLGIALLMVSSRELVGEDGLVVAAKLIGDAIKKGDNGNEVLSLCKIYASDDFALAMKRGGFFGVAGSAKLGAYDVDFGWGSPKKSNIPAVVTTGTMALNECPDEVGAVEVSLARSKTVMDAFSSLFVSNLKVFA